MRLRPWRREQDCSPPLPRELSQGWLLQPRARRLRPLDSRAELALLRLLLPRAEMLAAGPAAGPARAQEPCTQHLRVRLASSESLLLARFGLAHLLHWESQRRTV